MFVSFICLFKRHFVNIKSMLIFSTHFNNSKWQPSPFCKSDVIHFCGRGKSLAILDIGNRRESVAYYVINNQRCTRWNVSDLHEIYEKRAKFWEKWILDFKQIMKSICVIRVLQRCLAIHDWSFCNQLFMWGVLIMKYVFCILTLDLILDQGLN